MSVSVEYTRRFERALATKKKRSPELYDAVLQTVQQILESTTHPGLNTHLLDRPARIWDAYVNRAIRVTYQHEGDVFTFRNNCRHDIIERRQW